MRLPHFLLTHFLLTLSLLPPTMPLAQAQNQAQNQAQAQGQIQASVQDLSARPGWSVARSAKPYSQLLQDLKSAVKAQKFGVVTDAGPTEVARKRGVDLPGNRVVGVFNNLYAARVLTLSTAAMIEAPIRFYVTENTDGSASLSYKLPSAVFAPYLAEAGPDLEGIAAELDLIFATIAAAALQ